MYDGQTCPRCTSTGEELERAVSVLKQILAPLGIDITVEKDELSISEFRVNPLESNRIWIEDQPIEYWLSGGLDRAHAAICVDHMNAEQLKWKKRYTKRSLQT